DIALTKEMLVNAFHQNFNIGILVSGDEDYVSLVNEVKRYGAVLWGAFFNHGLSNELFLACDHFIKFNEPVTDKESWRNRIQKIESEVREKSKK
ncbi:MAG TPA: NYN domain-containing protein, partial [Anaerolineales bacterium]